MAKITWQEFKKQIEAVGVKDNTDIDYIDCGRFYTNKLSIAFDEKKNSVSIID